jgi:di/tricarboxylate transporter
MSAHLISIAVLLAVFLLGTVRPINLGALALVATFGVGLLVVGEDYKAVISGFPVDVFILLFGVTYLFGVASVNGTIEWLVNSAARVVRGNRIAIPWVLFFLAAIPTTAGAAGPAGVALLAPIALRMAQKYNINPRLAALMVINGSNSGNFSPLNVLGVIVNGTVERNGLHVEPVWIWLGNFGFTILLGVAAFAVFGGIDLVRRARAGRAEAAVPAAAVAVTASDLAGDPAGANTTPIDRQNAGMTGTTGSAGTGESGTGQRSVVPLVATLAAIVAVACGALVFGLDIGMLAVTAAVALHLFLPTTSAGALNKVSWNTVLLIGGIVTYVALLQRMGTVKMIGDSVAGIRAPLLAAFLLCLIAAATSAFASSIGVLGALIPLAVPFLLTGDVTVTGVVIALAISGTAVDATPFSSLGALTVASAPEPERDRLYRGLIRWGFSMVIVAPVATWLAFIAL